VRAGAGHRIADVVSARTVILAVDALTQPDAHALGALTRKPLNLTGDSIDLVRVGARGIQLVTHIVRARVAIAAIDIATKLGVHTDAGLADTRKLAELTLRPIRAMRMGALAGAAVAEVLGAFVLVVAIDAFTQAHAHPGRTSTRILAQRTCGPFVCPRMVATAIGSVTHVVGAGVAIVTVDTFTPADAGARQASPRLSLDRADSLIGQRREDTQAVQRIARVSRAVVAILAEDVLTEVGLIATSHNAQRPNRNQHQHQTKQPPHRNLPVYSGFASHVPARNAAVSILLRHRAAQVFRRTPDYAEDAATAHPSEASPYDPEISNPEAGASSPR
jgi:hypothetical protein